MRLRRTPLLPSLFVAVLLAACAHTPPPEPPAAPVPAQFKEIPPGWVTATPSDQLARGPWWTLFGDPALDSLVPRVQVSNQNVAAAAAAYAQARALVREQRAALFPSLSLSAAATRSHAGSATPSPGSSTGYQLGLNAGWEADLWGRIGNTVSAAGARAQASAADLAAATLSAQAEFVTDYLSLRETDAEIALVSSTIDGYARSLQIAQNRYDAGVAPKSDVLQAQTQLASAQADRSALVRQRAQLEHAMAVLVGEAPAQFSLPTGDWHSTVVPRVPVSVPSTLLQRRPDIASAERAVAAANDQVGVERAAYFPALTLSAGASQAGTRVSDLFSLPATTWSIGLALAQTLFDAGARTARVDEARAAWEQSVASYRQAVLTAFQDVEDQLVAARELEVQQGLRRTASEAADQTEQQVMNRYRAAQVSYTEVVTAQATALSARRTLLQVASSRQLASVALIQALGGGWDTSLIEEPAAAK
ncbi:efflux transporter outer membrane subunit [Ideonella sp. YS5]|uniref:efflux transporter outer membrane subunit n=1 Tax=Ideonella sp. YS5 TaxID=3453714 RepID=UPI003EEA73C4